jgi:hypothetical protein
MLDRKTQEADTTKLRHRKSLPIPTQKHAVPHIAIAINVCISYKASPSSLIGILVGLVGSTGSMGSMGSISSMIQGFDVSGVRWVRWVR